MFPSGLVTVFHIILTNFLRSVERHILFIMTVSCVHIHDSNQIEQFCPIFSKEPITQYYHTSFSDGHGKTISWLILVFALIFACLFTVVFTLVFPMVCN